MASRINPSSSDGRERNGYTNLDASARRVLQRLTIAYPAGQRQKRFPRRSWLAIAAAVLLLVVATCWWLVRPEPYERLAAEYRLPFQTSELSVNRSVGPDREAVLLAEAISSYNDKKYKVAITQWAELAANARPENTISYRFYQGASAWLARQPGEAIGILSVLRKTVSPDHEKYRSITYVLAMSYVDEKHLSAATPLLEMVAGKNDLLGERARRMMVVMPKA
jgi:hypothetical protein